MRWPLSRPRRSVPTPENAPVHQSTNPLFEPQTAGAWRTRVIGWTAVVFVIGGVGWWVYGPANRITDVRITGTVFVSPDSVRQVTEYYLNRWRWLILWQRQSVLVQTGTLAKNIQKKIEERIAVKNVVVDLKGRHGLNVAVVERVPVALWTSGETVGWLDDTGTIVQSGPPDSQLELLPLRDESALPFAPAQQVISEAAAQSLLVLNDAFKQESLEVAEYRLPQVTCLELPPEEEPETNSNVNSATNNNANTNSSVELNTNVATEVVNGNVPAGLANTNTELPCDPEELRLSRPEIDVVLRDGPLAKFDRFTDLSASVKILKAVLAEKQNSGATVIDLRFGKRVYVR